MHGTTIVGGINRSSSLGERKSHLKRNLKQNTSPTTPLSLKSFSSGSTNATPNDVIDNSIEFPSNDIKSIHRSTNMKVVPSKRSNLEGKPPMNKRNICSKRFVSGEANRDLGSYLLKKANDLILNNNLEKAFEVALRAKKHFEDSISSKSNLDYIMCLHVLASIYCCLGQYKNAIPLLEHSVEILDIKLSQKHALAKFVGCMRLGDIYATLGKIDKSILLYKDGLELQKEVVGEYDPSFVGTCRYVAEAHIQAFQLDEAEKLCQLALNGCSYSMDEAANRRLMGLICDSKGNHEDALEHFNLARAINYSTSTTLSIGSACLALARYEEAIFSYKKALSDLKCGKEQNEMGCASIFVHLAELHSKIGKFDEVKSYCEKALEIYNKQDTNSNTEDIVGGLIDLATIYESMNDLEFALSLLQKALDMYNDDQPDRCCRVAGIEAQMGVIYFILGKYVDSYNSLKGSISKFQTSGATKSSLYGITLNQLGLTCIQLQALTEATKHFEEAKTILEIHYGLHHPDTLVVYSNLACTYENLGRLDDATNLLEFVVGMREDILGTADPIVDEEKMRLTRLFKETGRKRRRNSRSLEILLDKNTNICH